MNVSPTLNCQNIIKDRVSKGLPVYNFGLGANPLAPPQYYIDCLEKYSSLKDYTPPEGVQPLQEAIKKNFQSDVYQIKNILTGNGLKELLFIIQLSFTGTIIHITPSWVSYKEQMRLLGRLDRLIEIEAKMEDDYKINLKILDDVLSGIEGEKLIIFNNPCNPTGIHYTPIETELIAEVLNKHNCLVMADEIYMNLVHNTNDQIVSISKFIPHLTIRGSSVSKDLACGGHRLGWITFPEELEDLFNVCRSNVSAIYSCVCTPVQYATACVLNTPITFSSHCIVSSRLYNYIASNAWSRLTVATDLKVVRPTAAWYIFVNFSEYEDGLKKININNDKDLCNHLMNEYGIVTVPGSAFNVEGLNLRFSLVDIDTDSIHYDDRGRLEKRCYRKVMEGMNKLIEFVTSLDN